MTIFLDKLGMMDLHLIAMTTYPDIFEATDLNNRGYADAMWFRKDDKCRQIEIKQGLEANPTQLTEQLQRQRPMADITDLLIWGPVTQCGAGSLRWVPAGNFFRKGKETRQDFMWYRRELARFEDEGTRVYEVATAEDAVTQLVALYRNDQEPKEGVFDRLIVEKKYISEDEFVKRSMALSLMGLSSAKIGEEIALALSDAYFSMWDLLMGLTTIEGQDRIARVPLRSGKRTVGPAAVQRLRASLGIQ